MADELELLKRLGRELAEPDEESASHARSLLEQRIGLASPRGSASSMVTGRQADRRWSSPIRLRWGLLFAAVGLLVGSGLGFGVGNSVTPSGSAGGSVIGFGFIPARGWTVVQSGTVDATGTASAIAGTVPVDRAAPATGSPYAALRRLPPNGALILARFSPRGDDSSDSRFPLRTLPLRVGDADPARLPPALSSTSLVALSVRAGVNGHNVDANVYFGQPPSPAALAEVDRQLERLVVGASAVTLVVQPRIVSSMSQRMLIYGSVSSGSAGQKVTIQFRACGSNPPEFRDVLETTTRAGGGFSFAELQPFTMGVSGVFQAASGNDVSSEVAVQQQAGVFLAYPRNGRFRAGVQAMVPLWRRHVLLQRFERARGTWITVRRLVLTDQQVPPSGPGLPSIPRPRTFYTDPFRPAVRKGTAIRVVFPLSQARPCYLAGVSEVRRT